MWPERKEVEHNLYLTLGQEGLHGKCNVAEQFSNSYTGDNQGPKHLQYTAFKNQNSYKTALRTCVLFLPLIIIMKRDQQIAACLLDTYS